MIQPSLHALLSGFRAVRADSGLFLGFLIISGVRTNTERVLRSVGLQLWQPELSGHQTTRDEQPSPRPGQHERRGRRRDTHPSDTHTPKRSRRRYYGPRRSLRQR